MNIIEVSKKENVGKVYEIFIDGVSEEAWELKDGFSTKEFEFFKDGEALPELYFSSQIARMEFEEIFDWSKIPVDTKILVSDNKLDWFPMYFALYEDGTVYAWEKGKSSFTVYRETKEYMDSWKYVKLYQE